MIKNVLLDMDMTILDFDKAEHQAFQRAFGKLGLEFHEEVYREYHEINKEQWRLLEQGLLTRDKLKQRRFEVLFEKRGIELSPALAAQTYESLLGEGYDYMPEAKEMLEDLYGRYRLYIFSNGSSEIQHSRIKGAKLESYFDGIYISEDIGYNKPDKAFFDACFRDIERKAGEPLCLEETVMIGDSLTSDIQGGINAGVRTIWFHPQNSVSGDIRPDYEITDLRELSVLLQGL